MDKKFVIALIVVILVGIGVWFYANRPVRRGVSPVVLPEKIEMIEKRAAFGQSIAEDEIAAAQEAVGMMRKKLIRTPDFAFLFSSEANGYDLERLLAKINELLPETKIYGGTAYLGPMTPEEYLGKYPKSVAILGIAVDEISWGVGGVADVYKNPRLAGKEAVSKAITNAGKELTDKPAIVFITVSPGTEEEIIAGIEEIVGPDVPIIGGSSGDNKIAKQWRQFANDKVYAQGLAVAVAFTDLKVAFKYEAGYPVIGKGGTITKGEGRRIYEIDGRPAAKVYNEWTNGAFSSHLEKPGVVWGILKESTLYPLAKVLRAPGKEPFYLAIHPLSILEDLSIETFANVKKGDEIVLMEGTWEVLLDRFRTTPEKAMREFDLKKGEAIFGLYTFCAGTKLVIPKEEREKMRLLLNETIGPVPYLTNFTFGEQGFVPGIGNLHGNLVNSIVLFVKK